MASDENQCLGSLEFLSASFCSLLLDHRSSLRPGVRGLVPRPCSDGKTLPEVHAHKYLLSGEFLLSFIHSFIHSTIVIECLLSARRCARPWDSAVNKMGPHLGGPGVPGGQGVGRQTIAQ